MGAQRSTHSVVQDLPERERPLSEQFRVVALQFADADAAASMYEEAKGTTFAKLVTAIAATQPNISEARAERMVKASDEWSEYLEAMRVARAKATKLKLQLDYIRMKFSEWQSREANSRHEARLSR